MKKIGEDTVSLRGGAPAVAISFPTLADLRLSRHFVPHNDKIGCLAEINHMSLRGIVDAVAIYCRKPLFCKREHGDTLRRRTPAKHELQSLQKQKLSAIDGCGAYGNVGILCVGVILTAPSGAQNHSPSSRLWQSAKPIAVLHLHRRTLRVRIP